MPRIRTIKPEALQHRKVGRLSHLAFRLWVGLITQADDEGRLVWDSEQFSMLVFGYHRDVTSDKTTEALEEITGHGLARLYRIGDTDYVDLPSWRDHQSINKATASRLPAYEDSDPTQDSRPRSVPVVLPERSGNTPVGSEGGKDLTALSGSERANRTSGRSEPAPKSQNNSGRKVIPGTDLEAAPAILAYLNEKAGRRYRPAAANLDLIRGRLRDGIAADQLKAVIDSKCREWRGDPKMSKFLRPETLFNRTKCEQYLGELPQTGKDPEAVALAGGGFIR